MCAKMEESWFAVTTAQGPSTSRSAWSGTAPRTSYRMSSLLRVRTRIGFVPSANRSSIKGPRSSLRREAEQRRRKQRHRSERRGWRKRVCSESSNSSGEETRKGKKKSGKKQKSSKPAKRSSESSKELAKKRRGAWKRNVTRERNSAWMRKPKERLGLRKRSSSDCKNWTLRRKQDLKDRKPN